MWGSFSIWLGMGAALGLAWTAGRAPAETRERLVDAGLLILLGAFLGARAGFVWAHASYFQAHVSDAPQVWLGGLSWPGAVVGALLVFAAACLIWRLSPAVVADGLLPLALPVIVGAWLGAWQSGGFYGQPSTAWFALPTLDESGSLAARFPLAPGAALLSLALFALIDGFRQRLPHPGQAAALALLGFGLLMLAASLLRGNLVPLYSVSLLQNQVSLRPDTAAAAALALLGCAACLPAFIPRAHPNAAA